MSGGPIEISLEELLIYEVLVEDGVEEEEAARVAREGAEHLRAGREAARAIADEHRRQGRAYLESARDQAERLKDGLRRVLDADQDRV